MGWLHRQLSRGGLSCRLHEGPREIDHFVNHPNCYGEIRAQARLQNQLGCSSEDWEPHFGSDPDGDYAEATQLCLVNCNTFYNTQGTFSWNFDEHQEFDLGETVRFRCSENCNPPPSGCPTEGCVWDEWLCDCVDCCPLVFDTSGRGYKLTSADRGVLFDINADGLLDAISWTDPTRDVAFLVFDRNGNRSVDHGEELFGNSTPLPSGSGRAADGFDALASLESPEYGPGLRDGVLDANDSAYHRLLFWHDRNKDGVSQTDELSSASGAGLMAIESRYRKSKRVDAFGNEFRLRGVSWWQRNGLLVPRLFYDVWFVPRR